MIGTNQVCRGTMDSDTAAAQRARHMNVELINLSPVGGFVVAFQVAFYGGMVLAGPFIFYFIASFVFPALKLDERKYVYRGMFYGGGLFLAGVAFCYLRPDADGAGGVAALFAMARDSGPTSGGPKITSVSSANSCSGWGSGSRCRW